MIAFKSKNRLKNVIFESIQKNNIKTKINNMAKVRGAIVVDIEKCKGCEAASYCSKERI